MTLLDPTQQVIEALSDAGLNVGDHVAPASTDGRIVAPCVVVYLTSSPTMRASLAGGDTALVRWRVVSVACTAAEALHVAGEVNDVLHDRQIGTFRPRRQSYSGLDRDDTTTPPLYYCTALYQAPIDQPRPEEDTS